MFPKNRPDAGGMILFFIVMKGFFFLDYREYLNTDEFVLASNEFVFIRQ